jgi:hypothetical protein
LSTFLAQSAKNRAFRSNSSVLLSQALRDFRFNAPEDGRFPIGMDCSGRYRAPGIPCAAQRQPQNCIRNFATSPLARPEAFPVIEQYLRFDETCFKKFFAFKNIRCIVFE